MIEVTKELCKEVKRSAYRDVKSDFLANDGELALRKAINGDQAFADSEYAQDTDIVSQQGGKVAYWLAHNSYKTGWDTDNYDILTLYNNLVALYLAKNSASTGWVTYDLRVLLLFGGEIAYMLNCGKSSTGWKAPTDNIKKVIKARRELEAAITRVRFRDIGHL